jgi:hypothetical protein
VSGDFHVLSSCPTKWRNHAADRCSVTGGVWHHCYLPDDHAGSGHRHICECGDTAWLHPIAMIQLPRPSTMTPLKAVVIGVAVGVVVGVLCVVLGLANAWWWPR